jgi:hypothetical protein
VSGSHKEKLLDLSDVKRLLPKLELSKARDKLSTGHRQALNRAAVSAEGFSDSSTRLLLSHLAARCQDGLCTLRQAAALESFGVTNPSEVLFEHVDSQLSQARRRLLPERIEKYLQGCEPAISGQHGHNRTFLVALALVQGFALDQEEALPFLLEYNLRCQPPWNEADLKHKLANAAAGSKSTKPRGYLLDADQIPVLSAGTSPPLQQPKAQYEPEYLEAFTRELTDTIDEAYLEIRSEFTCWNRSPAGFLHKLFRLGESVWVTDNSHSRDGLVWTHDGAVQNLAELAQLQTGKPSVWFLANPIDGAPHQVERLKSEHNTEGVSFRATECVTDWRHVVLETDKAPEALWLKALVLLALPIVAIYHSGGRGAHAVVNLGAATLEQWHERLEPHREHLIRLGACPGTLTPVRLSRLPNCVRGQTGRPQQLLYLVPTADGTPIADRIVREESLAVRERYLAAVRNGPA